MSQPMASPSRGASNSYVGDGSDADMGVDELEQRAEDEEDEDAEPVRPPSASALSSVDMTVKHTGVLDCRICFLALKPPIFQCDVGHVVCSSCRGNLLTEAAASGRCPVCRETTRFRRCHDMEQVVDSLLVPCPHATQGCAAKPAYHSRHAHAEACAYAPYRCPADTCGFVGPMLALLEHFADAHGWPCTAETSADSSFDVHLRDGFNFLTAVRDQGTAATQHVFLLNVVLAPYGRTVAAVCLQPRSVAGTGSSSSPPATTTTKRHLYLSYSCYKPDSSCRRLKRSIHSQLSRFEVPCVDPSHGSPDPNVCFQFFIPKYIPDHDDDPCKVVASVTIGEW